MSQLLPAALNQTLDDKRALELRLEGKDWNEIADIMGITPRNARSMVKRAMNVVELEVAELAEDLRDLIVTRNEKLVTALFPGAMKLDLFAIDRIVKLQEQSAKLMGSYPKDRGQADEGLQGPIIVLPAILSEQSSPEGLPPPEPQMVVGGMVVASQEPEDVTYPELEEPDDSASQSHHISATPINPEPVEAPSGAADQVYEQSGVGGALWRQRRTRQNGLPRDGSDQAD